VIEIAQEGDWIVVRLEGDIDIVSAPAAQDGIAELQALGYNNVRVDLGRVEFLDSQGLNLLVAVRKRALDAGGEIQISNASHRILELLRLTNLDEVFTIVRSPGDEVA